MASQETLNQMGQFLATLMGSLLKKSDSGPLGHFREIGSFASYVKTAGDTYSDNDFIQALLNNEGDENTGDISQPDEIDDDQLLADLKSYVASLASETDNLTQVKEFIYGAAEAFAGAAGGGFLGSGKKINEDEQAFLDSLKSALEL